MRTPDKQQPDREDQQREHAKILLFFLLDGNGIYKIPITARPDSWNAERPNQNNKKFKLEKRVSE